MRISRILAGAIAALALLPATALGQTPAELGDHYLAPIFLANEQQPIPPPPSVLGFEIPDTTAYTTDDGQPIFGGGPEYNACTIGSRTSNYGKTAWSVLYTDRYGRLDITATGYDAVIGFVTFNSPNDPTPRPIDCIDRLAGRIESFSPDALPTVRKNSWYAIQVGGYFDPNTQQFASGNLQLNIELLKPLTVIGDAGIIYSPTSSGIKLQSVRVEGPNGAVATVTCARKSCGRRASVRNPKPVGVFRDGLLRAKVDGTAGGVKGLKGKPATLPSLEKTVFKGRKVPNGARLQVIVAAENQIGQAYYWDIKGDRAGSKKAGCVEPGSSVIRKTGTCDGK